MVNQHSQSCITWDSLDAKCCRALSPLCFDGPAFLDYVGWFRDCLAWNPLSLEIVGMCTCLSGIFHPVVCVSCCFSQYCGAFEVHAVPCLDDMSSSNSYLQPSPTGFDVSNCVPPRILNSEWPRPDLGCCAIEEK